MSQPERESFARVMLGDVIAAVTGAGCTPLLLCTHPYSCAGVETVVKEKGLNDALNECLGMLNGPVLIIMADLPLATADAVGRFVSSPADVAIAPGRGGGTNAIFVKDPRRFHVDFYGASFLDHMDIAREAGLTVEVFDSFRLHTDIDEKEDLVEILLHGEGKSRESLLGLGFSLSVEHGRVGVQRNPHE